MKPIASLARTTLAALVTLAFLPGIATADVVHSGTGCLRVGTGVLWKIAEGSAPLSPCVAGEVIAHISGGDITAVATPDTGGLQGGTDNGDASLSLQTSFRLPQACTPGQVPRWNGTSWECAPGTGGGALSRLEDLGGLPCGSGPDAGTVSLAINPLNRSVSFSCPRIGEFQLDVAVSGRGTVTTAISDIACGDGLADCSQSYTSGQVVTLTETETSKDAKFFGWGGACAGAAAPACDVTMDQARLVTAQFAPTLTITLATIATERQTACLFNICELIDDFASSFARVTVTDLDTGTQVGACDASTTATVILPISDTGPLSTTFTTCDIPVLPGHHVSLHAEDSTTLGGNQTFGAWVDGPPCFASTDPTCAPADPFTVHQSVAASFHR